jgi:peptidoglycan hydrolase CwlO-like protein
MTNFVTKHFKLPIEEIVMITVPRENFIMAAIIGGGLGILAAMFHNACKTSCWEASNAEHIAKIDQLQDQCGCLENDVEVLNQTVEDKDKDIVRLNHELTTAHEQIAALEKKMTELKESYSMCRTSAEDFVKMFREKTD